MKYNSVFLFKRLFTQVIFLKGEKKRQGWRQCCKAQWDQQLTSVQILTPSE